MKPVIEGPAQSSDFHAAKPASGMTFRPSPGRPTGIEDMLKLFNPPDLLKAISPDSFRMLYPELVPSPETALPKDDRAILEADRALATAVKRLGAARAADISARIADVEKARESLSALVRKLHGGVRQHAETV